jgi:hypothetical protein
MSDAVVMRDVLVVGGGCYGTFYAAQLAKAQARGKARFRRVIVVDRDRHCRARRELGAAADRAFVIAEWQAGVGAFLDRATPPPPGEPEDYIVPSPHMPHLMFAWVLERARARWPDRAIAVAPVPGTLATPYDRTASDATRYVSFADWICPTHCIEPAICPAIGSTRDWDMGTAVERLAASLRAAGEPVHGSALFVCRHHVFGVGTFPVAAVLAGDAVVATAGASGAPAAVLVGTISACHGALNLVRLGAAAEAGRAAR